MALKGRLKRLEKQFGGASVVVTFNFIGLQSGKPMSIPNKTWLQLKNALKTSPLGAEIRGIKG